MSMSKQRRFFLYKQVSHRLFYAVLLVGAVAALLVAWYLQNVRDLAPCPLCIMPRFGFWALAIFALIGLLKGSLGRVGNALAVLAGASGVSVAAYHNWILAQPKVECGIDPVQNFVNDLPTADLWPDMFMATGMCGAKLPLILGISIPQWALLGLACLTLGFSWRLLRR